MDLSHVIDLLREDGMRFAISASSLLGCAVLLLTRRWPRLRFVQPVILLGLFAVAWVVAGSGSETRQDIMVFFMRMVGLLVAVLAVVLLHAISMWVRLPERRAKADLLKLSWIVVVSVAALAAILLALPKASPERAALGGMIIIGVPVCVGVWFVVLPFWRALFAQVK
jgi:hypothetical protein